MFTYKEINFEFNVIKKKQNKFGEVPTSPSDGIKKNQKILGISRICQQWCSPNVFWRIKLPLNILFL
jgi:hypothetical protein